MKHLQLRQDRRHRFECWFEVVPVVDTDSKITPTHCILTLILMPLRCMMIKDELHEKDAACAKTTLYFATDRRERIVVKPVVTVVTNNN